MEREQAFPIGASITVDEFTDSPYDVLAALRDAEPVSWVPALNAWFVTRRDLAIEAMVDAQRFTVDDERFSTARVLGTSMLSLDGPDHTRHRSAFARPFRPKYVREHLQPRIHDQATRLFAETLTTTREVRTGLAGPLAVQTILDLLGLADVTPTEVLSWYEAFGRAIVAVTLDEPIPGEVHDTLSRLYGYVGAAIGSDDAGLIAELVADNVLLPDEIPAAVAVVMFGAIETSEGMTANAFWHLLNHPEQRDRLRQDQSLIPRAIDESLRLEPAAAWIDRYTTSDVELGGVSIPKGELVTISLLAANRDPAVFEQPDEFDIDRPNLARHVTFVQGPHACIGLHVARAETHAALCAWLDWETETGGRLQLDADRSSPPEGLIFRKAKSVVLRG